MEFEIFDENIYLDESLIEGSEEDIRRQISEFENGDREAFDFRIDFPDSFTGEVMREMSRIPYGETRSYGEIADSLNSAAVAVGQACGNNPMPVVVPCHRVIGENDLGGYSGGLELKRKLLEMENTLED